MLQSQTGKKSTGNIRFFVSFYWTDWIYIEFNLFSATERFLMTKVPVITNVQAWGSKPSAATNAFP